MKITLTLSVFVDTWSLDGDKIREIFFSSFCLNAAYINICCNIVGGYL